MTLEDLERWNEDLDAQLFTKQELEEYQDWLEYGDFTYGEPNE